MTSKLFQTLCLSIVLCAWSHAQESKDILNLLVDKNVITQHEADEWAVECEKKTFPPVVQWTKSAFQSEAFHLSGYGQIYYDWKKEVAPGDVNHSINIARAILFAVGKLGNHKQFGYMLMYDFGPNHKLHELYGEWLPINALNVRFGQFKIPFTLENPMSPTRIETIQFTRSALALSGSTGDFNGLTGGSKAGRDAGVQLSGSLFPNESFNRLEYYAGLFNGTGLNTSDNNNHKDFIGTIYWRLLKELRVGGSVYAGKTCFGLNPEQLSTFGLNDKLPTGNHVRNRWAAGVEYNGKYAYVRSEYISGNDGGLKRIGYYASSVLKFIPDQWEVLGKYDFYDKNTAISNNEIQELTAGLNYYFAYLCRLQLNYIYTDEKNVGKNHAFSAQLQLFF
jgi:hypothetical protein